MRIAKRGKGTKEGKTIQLSLVWLVILSAGMLLTGGLLVHGLICRDASNLGAEAPNSKRGGPWGKLRIFEIEVERPEEYVAEEISTNAPLWHFEKQTPEQIRMALLGCGVATNAVERLLAPERLSATGPTLALKPDEETILSLSPDTRAKVYRLLAQHHNLYMEYPFCFPRTAFESLFAQSGLDPATVTLIKSLLFPRGNADCFSDLEVVMHRLESDAERLKALKVLSRQSAILVRLEINGTTDTDKLLAYWNRGLRRTNLRPLMESLKRLPEGGTMSALYLLPPFARDRLYTYPDPAELAKHPRMDCHWSSLNFFRETPDDRYGDPYYAAQYLQQNYAMVPLAKCQYGDIILLVKPNNEAIHSAVYLADDIVFTKNGLSRSQPWILMRLKDMLATFPSESIIKVLAYRNKNG